MCGISGYWQRSKACRDVALRMAEQIRNRGPDSFGAWCDQEHGVALAHRRLSIIDLSEAGDQPMQSQCGRFVIIFNGEIYNHLELRKELENGGKLITWRGTSDTETLLACFVSWGIEKTLKRLVGMFAFALWDNQEKVLTLSRDRMGEKPLYWGWDNELLLFGSELKALKAHPDFNPEVDRDALALLLRHCYIPAPYSIYKGIQKLPPGHVLSIPLHGNFAISKKSVPQPYWVMTDAVEEGLKNPFTGSAEAAIDALESQLKSSISGQMLSDVPLGAFLSGGIDSSTIVALMQAQSSRPIKTFTIGFNQDGYNEAEHAKSIAQHLGTEHTELYVNSEDALALIPKLSSIYCEPFADSSQIPTFLVSKMAKEDVTVALSGDGGDELFAGYNRYLAARKVWKPIQKLPPVVRKTAAGLLRSIPPGKWDKLFDSLRPVLPKKLQLSIPGEKARKLADVLAVSDGHSFYRQLTSHWLEPESIVIGATEPNTLISDSRTWPETDCLEHSMMALDAQTYLADDILVKLDRAGMANSLEARVPMLDHRLVELAWRMPIDYKIKDGQGKWLLRQVLYRHVPNELIDRPKMGFGIPLDSWLRGPLRDWAEALLDHKRLLDEGYFRPEPIRKMWSEHLSGKKNWQYHLWNILMFQSWLENN